MRQIFDNLRDKDYICEINSKYQIGFCKKSEIHDVICFIDKFWKKNHALTLSHDLLEWQHYNQEEDRYNFVLARNMRNNEIDAIMGYLTTRHFDSEILPITLSPCIWKSRGNEKGQKGLGSALYLFLNDNLPLETVFSPGASDIALKIYQKWGFEVNHIEHFYFPNMEQVEKLTAFRQQSTVAYENKVGWHLRELRLYDYLGLSEEEEIFNYLGPYKSKQYYVNRYFKHPVYQYKALAVMYEKCVKCVIIVRECSANGGHCLRIIDYIGEIVHLANVRRELLNILIQNHYEYLDFVEIGVEQEHLIQAGFLNRRKSPKTIIPHHYEPFEFRNIELRYAWKSIRNSLNPKIVKGDADQDRPNLLMKEVIQNESK